MTGTDDLNPRSDGTVRVGQWRDGENAAAASAVDGVASPSTIWRLSHIALTPADADPNERRE